MDDSQRVIGRTIKKGRSEVREVVVGYCSCGAETIVARPDSAAGRRLLSGDLSDAQGCGSLRCFQP